ncbi:MAG: pyruvate kinase, partial [Xanthomonadales bacterium]|nr:pyruvate kinase [Gammaproteobacteria bacterium]NNK04362.1 pyruvate kinase [Xanthomonadales bacterium]
MHIRRTKIIATLGPATDTPESLRDLIAAGADILRINMSHGTHDEQAARATLVREVARGLGKEVAILADLRGPKVRIEKFKDGSVELKSGDTFTLDASDQPAIGNQSRVGLTYKGLPGDVDAGDLLLLDDGLLTMRVVEISGTDIVCKVETGGALGDRKG